MFEIHAVTIQSGTRDARTGDDSKLFFGWYPAFKGLMDLYNAFRDIQNFFIQAKIITVTALFIVLNLQEFVRES